MNSVPQRVGMINSIIQQKQYKKYLEIGVRRGYNIRGVICEHKDGVDPFPKRCSVEYEMTSDKFFDTISKEQMYDIIFIDGMHEKNQFLRDVINSLKHLTVGGTIVAHDCNPKTKALALKGRCYNIWTAIVELRERTDLSVCVVDIDHGHGIIRRGRQAAFKLPKNFETTFEYLAKNRKELLNLITLEEFEKGEGND
jgi:predicted O-methyltransferase YrrM